MHDRKAFTDSGWEELLADTSAIADPAYQGTRAIIPRKKSQGGELSTGGKANNRTISSLRSAVERCIARLKNWKILATTGAASPNFPTYFASSRHSNFTDSTGDSSE